MDQLSKIYLFFARFVNADAISREQVNDKHRGVAELHTEALRECVDRFEWDVEPGITDYIFGSDLKFILQAVKNSKGKILFVEVGEGTYNAMTESWKMPVAVTVAAPFSTTTGSQLSQLKAQDECINILKKIMKGVVKSNEEECIFASVDTTMQTQLISPEAFVSHAGVVGYFNIEICN